MEQLILMVNLPDAVIRRARMERLLASLGLRCEIVEGVAGRTLEPAWLRERFRHHDRMTLSAGEYGCLLSHAACWRRLLASDAAVAVVREDDLHMAGDFATVLQALDVRGDVPAVYRFETMGATVTADARPMQRLAKRRVFEIHTNHGGTAAYALNRAAAALLLEALPGMTHAVDIEMFSPERRLFDGPRIYQIAPAPCIQDMFLPPSRQVLCGDSGIGAQRADRLVFAPAGDGLTARLRGQARDALRPLYRMLHTLWMLPSGRRRLRVRYHAPRMRAAGARAGTPQA